MTTLPHGRQRDGKVALPLESLQGGSAPGLVARFRERTRDLHVVAEKSGFVAELLEGRGSRAGYVSMLRNLLPAYGALERGIERHRDSALFRGVEWTSLFRAPALEQDLSALQGAGWRSSVALLPAAQAYARRVELCADGNGERLIAHAYTRYLGDLSGGQIIKRLLGKSLSLEAGALAFYDFPDIVEAADFKAAFRDAIDFAGARMYDVDGVVEEAAISFQLNIDLSIAIQSQR